MEEKKRDWKKIAAVAFCAVLLGLNLWQLRRISDLRGQLQSVETNLQMETRRLDERVQAMQRTAQEADTAILNWEYAAAVNKEQRVLDVMVDLSLKEWSVDTAVWVNWTSLPDGRTGSEPLRGGRSGHLTGTLKLPVGGRREYTLEAVIQNGESQRLEDLGYLGDTTTLLPVQCYSYGVGGPTLSRYASRPDLLTISDCDVNLEGCKGEPLPDLSNQVFRLRRNGEIAEETTAMYGETIGQYTCEQMSIEIQPGDEMELTFFCRDNSGLGYEFSLRSWTVNESGVGEQASPEESWPKLTWD